MLSHCPVLFTKTHLFVTHSFLSLLQTGMCTIGNEIFVAFQEGTWSLLVCKNCEAASLWSISATEGKKQHVQKQLTNEQRQIYINNCWVERRVSHHSEQKCGQYLLEVESHPSLQDFNLSCLGLQLVIVWEQGKAVEGIRSGLSVPHQPGRSENCRQNKHLQHLISSQLL